MKSKLLFLYFFLLCFSLQNAVAQENFVQQGSAYTYIFKISDAQAMAFYTEEKPALDEAYFKQLIDSFPIRKTYTKTLPVGHYIKTNARRNIQQTYYQNVKDFEVFVLNNAKDLMIQVYDATGKPSSKAEVKVDDKLISFDETQMAFVDIKSNEKGLLKVTNEGFTAFYTLERSRNSSFLSRASKKLAYKYPTKYVWLPIEYITMLPVDGVRSIQNSYPVGRVHNTKNFFVRLYQRTSCWLGIDEYWCDRNDKNKDYEVAYFVFNKPKFKPNDTLKGKAFIWDAKGKALNTPLNLVLYKRYSRESEIKLKTIRPEANGSYSFEVHLHDSLALVLDQAYVVELEDEEANHVISEYFQYEEYELKGLRLDLQMSATEHYRGEDLEVTLSAKDENDLRILDGSIEIELLTKKSDYQAEDYVFVPDTLWTHQPDLSSSKLTKFRIPSTIFPKANVEYKLLAKLRTSDQEYIETSENITYQFDSEKIEYQVLGDSILVEFLQNGKKIATDFSIETRDYFGKTTLVAKETTPYEFKIDALTKDYVFKAKEVEKELNLNSISTGISPRLFRTKDSVFIEVINPNQYTFNYHIFKENKEIEQGFGNELNFSAAEKSLANYYLSLNYMWAGKVLQRNYSMPINDKNLSLNVNQPKLIYPGQEVEVEVTVLDNKKQPVQNADVLAYGMTSKFDYLPSGINNYSTLPKNRKLRNSFSIERISDQVFTDSLNIERWDDLAALKKLNYYQLTYPTQAIYKEEFPLENQPTQFAPFVVKQGEILPVHIIYVNKKPVYFSDMTNAQPYSFVVDSLPVQVQLRTQNHLISLDSIQFKKQHKTVFSLDVDGKYPDVTIEKVASKLTNSELITLRKYVLPYRLFSTDFAYIENQGRYHLMHTSTNRYARHLLLGPIYNKELRFVQNKQYELNFQLETNYSYEFKPLHLVQRPFPESGYPTFLGNKDIPSFYDVVFTKNKVEALSELRLNQVKQNINLFSYPSYTKRGNGNLVIETEKTPSTLFLINLADQEDYRIYRGNERKFYNLKPSTYRLILIEANQDYTIKEDIQVKSDGTTYLKLNKLPLLKRDSFSDEVAANISAIIFDKENSIEKRNQQRRKIREVYDNFEDFFGPHHVFEGVVIDGDGVPLPGVNVSVSGTNYGTSTDFDGNFQLRVPKNVRQVEIQYLGFIPQFFEITSDRFEQISLIPDGLDEVVVTGYSTGAYNKGYEASVESEMAQFADNRPNASFIESLLGQVAGVSMTNANGVPDYIVGQPGVVSNVNIRGISAVNGGSTPLIVINGIIYDGDISSIAADVIQDITILKDAAATAIYGSRGANGVIFISTTQTDLQTEVTDIDLPPDFAIESSQANSMRTNFSDEAFWKPELTTNYEGKVNFSITYPDDVTSWDTYFLAATASQQTGQLSQNVKSYRPLVSQLSIPRFLIEGDSLSGIGKVKNYVQDSIAIQTQYAINDEIQFTKQKEIVDFEADDLALVANSLDSLQISYQVTRKGNNYLDGEQLRIPVFPSGMEKAEGEFINLQSKDTLVLDFNTKLGDVHLRVDAQFNSILWEELDIVINYLHDCNEQIASRLKAQLIKRKIYQQQERAFEDEKEIKKLIGLLEKNQKSDSFWGWWANSSTNLWASLNVVEALLMAKKQDFKVKLDDVVLRERLINQFFLEAEVATQIQLLQLIDQLSGEINYRQEIERLLNSESIAVAEKFQLWELYQKHGGDLPLTQLMEYQKETNLGSWYFEAEEIYAFHPYKNSLQATLIAYRILRKFDNASKELEKIRDYLIRQRNFKGFANTYAAMQVIETLLGDLSHPGDLAVAYQIKVNNGAWQSYDVSTFSQVLKASDQVRLTHTSQLPIYVNYVQTYFDQAPEKREDVFEVETHFENEYKESIQLNEIQTGNPVHLQVDLKVEKQADYVMLEVPIPSGFSYHEKRQFPNETHREYAKDKTYIFLEAMQAGEYSYTITLMPRFVGCFQLNPAKVQLMYFEQFYGNTRIKQVKVRG